MPPLPECRLELGAFDSDGFSVAATGNGQRYAARVSFDHRERSHLHRLAQVVSTIEEQRELGRRLFDAAFQRSPRLEVFWHSFAEPLRLNQDEARFVLACHDETMANLPWECIFDGGNLGFVALRIHFLRGLWPSGPYPTPLNPRPSVATALVVASNPLDDLDLDIEVENCSASWSRLFDSTSIMKDATKAEIEAALRERECYLFHFAGHSALIVDVDERASSFVRVGRGSRGGVVESSEIFYAVDLARHVAVARTQVAVLNSCWSGQHRGGSLLNEFAKAGIRNIIAMNQPASDGKAIEFASAFYSRLADGGSLEQALTYARRTVCAGSGNSFAWGLPTAAFCTPSLSLR